MYLQLQYMIYRFSNSTCNDFKKNGIVTHFGLFGPAGPRGTRNSFCTLSATLGPKGPNLQSRRLRNLGFGSRKPRQLSMKAPTNVVRRVLTAYSTGLSKNGLVVVHLACFHLLWSSATHALLIYMTYPLTQTYCS